MKENSNIEQMLNDNRKITSVIFPDESTYHIKDGISIQIYKEPGVYDFIPYISISRNGVITSRFPAFMVEIHYD